MARGVSRIKGNNNQCSKSSIIQPAVNVVYGIILTLFSITFGYVVWMEFHIQTTVDNIKLSNVANPATNIAVVAMVVLVPLSQIVGLYEAFTSNHRKSVLSLLRYNRTFAVYHILSWICYIISITLLPKHKTKSNAIASTISGLLGQVCMISSFLTLRIKQVRYCRQKRLGNTTLWLKVYMNLVLVAASVSLAIASEVQYYAAKSSTDTYSFLLTTIVGSIVLFIYTLFNTHGLGGALFSQDWRGFWQPFTGGVYFVLLQIASWMFFCIGMLLQWMFLLSTIVFEIKIFAGVMGVASVLCILAEVLMLASVMVYENDSNTPSIVHSIGSQVSRVKHLAYVTAMANAPNAALPLSLIPYVMVHESVSYLSVLIAFFTLFSTMFLAVATFVVSHRILKKRYKYFVILLNLGAGSLPLVVIRHYYDQHNGALFFPSVILVAVWYTYFGLQCVLYDDPEVSGERTRHDWITSSKMLGFVSACDSYFSANIIRDGPEFDQNQKYIFGFHPHGIVPITVAWLQLTSRWKALFPGIYASPLVASVLHHVPICRDLLQLFGGRVVSRRGFRHALVTQKKSVILVPGGQTEMTGFKSGVRQIRLYTQHKGFLRMAIKTGTPVVPILSFKEVEILDYVRILPAVQRWSIKKIQIPFPFLAYGWLYFPIPNRVPLTIVVGQPIRVVQNDSPTEEALDLLHKLYFDSIKTLFHRYKDEAGCEDYELILK